MRERSFSGKFYIAVEHWSLFTVQLLSVSLHASGEASILDVSSQACRLFCSVPSSPLCHIAQSLRPSLRNAYPCASPSRIVVIILKAESSVSIDLSTKYWHRENLSYLIPAADTADVDGSHFENVKGHHPQLRNCSRTSHHTRRVDDWGENLAMLLLQWCERFGCFPVALVGMEVFETPTLSSTSLKHHTSHTALQANPVFSTYTIASFGTFSVKVDHGTRRLAFSTPLSRPCFVSVHSLDRVLCMTAAFSASQNGIRGGTTALGILDLELR